jgi:hypothetical protein
MNVLVSFKSESMLYGLSRFENHGMVKVVITLICQWVLRNQQHGRSIEWVLENIHKAVEDTYVHAEYLLTTTVEIDSRTGATKPIWHPTVASVSPGINYITADNHMRPEQWYQRYCELAEHLLVHYTRPLMGFYLQAQQDKHINSVQCIEFTDFYITLLARCYNLIEYQSS